MAIIGVSASIEAPRPGLLRGSCRCQWASAIGGYLPFSLYGGRPSLVWFGATTLSVSSKFLTNA